ncbi:hypothetical protein Lal_00031892, partial [Lupinus albus]
YQSFSPSPPLNSNLSSQCVLGALWFDPLGVIFNKGEFRDFIKRSSRGKRPSGTDIDKRVNREFVDWFRRRVSDQLANDDASMSDTTLGARGSSETSNI